MKLENARRQRSASTEECINGHPYSPENTYQKPQRKGQGRRDCRACMRERAQRYRSNRRAS